jgi:DNA-binding CsgD family transcriptional regulator
VIEIEHAKAATKEVMSAALFGGWEEALQRLADAAVAGGASIVRLRNGRAGAQSRSTAWAESEAEILAGSVPPSTRRFYPDRAYKSGFCIDHDVWTDDEIRTDAYFQEFLRPRGVFYHAKARLCCRDGERVTLTLKRRIGLGPYESHDIRVLDSLLPELHAAYRVAQRVLDAEAAGMVCLLHEESEPVFEIDSWSRVIRQHGKDAASFGLNVRNRQLLATERLEQTSLDRAVAMAARAQQPALAAITDAGGVRHFLQMIPVMGKARDVFGATAAIAAIIGSARPRTQEIGDLFRLTAREAQVALLLVEGLDLNEIAERLGLRIGTARNHLKRVFEKTGTHRQGELIALLSKLKVYRDTDRARQ